MYLLLFFLLNLKLFLVFRKFDYIVSCCGPIWAQTIWELLGPIIWMSISLLRSEKFSASIALNIISVPSPFLLNFHKCKHCFLPAIPIGFLHSFSFFLLLTQFSSVQSLSRVRLFATPWIAARQASLSITNSRSLLTLMSIESVMPSSHLTLFCPLLLLPPIPPSIRVFSN